MKNGVSEGGGGGGGVLNTHSGERSRLSHSQPLTWTMEIEVPNFGPKYWPNPRVDEHDFTYNIASAWVLFAFVTILWPGGGIVWHMGAWVHMLRQRLHH